MPAVEINYFNNKDNKYYFGSEWYLSKMPLSTANQITIEGSSKYFVDEQVFMFCETLTTEQKLRDNYTGVELML